MDIATSHGRVLLGQTTQTALPQPLRRLRRLHRRLALGAAVQLCGNARQGSASRVFIIVMALPNGGTHHFQLTAVTGVMRGRTIALHVPMVATVVPMSAPT